MDLGGMALGVSLNRNFDSFSFFFGETNQCYRYVGDFSQENARSLLIFADVCAVVFPRKHHFREDVMEQSFVS